MSTMKFQLVQDGKIWKVTLRAWESTRSEWPTRYKGKKCLQMEKNLDGSQLCFLTFFVAFFHILPKLTWRVWGSTFWKMEHLTDGLFYPHNHPNQVILQFLHPTRRWKTEPLSLLVGGAVPSPTPTDTEYLVGQNFQRWFWIGYPILMILCIYIYYVYTYYIYMVYVPMILRTFTHCKYLELRWLPISRRVSSNGSTTFHLSKSAPE